MKWREQIPGGKAKGMKPSDFDAVALAKGTLEEVREHGDFLVAVEVAMDHLAQDPNYYGRRSAPKRSKKRRAKPKVTPRRHKQIVNQLVRDQFRDIYGS